MSQKVFGLTGGIACGKSTVTCMLRAEGVHVVDADDVAREVTSLGSLGLRRLVSSFGEKILTERGELDRAALGALAFFDPDIRARVSELLDSLIHARSLELINEALRGEGRLVGYDASLLIEKGYADVFRPLIVVTAPEEVQLARLRARDGFSEPEARARVASQMPLPEKSRRADYLLDNGGDEDSLRSQVLVLLEKLRT